MTPLYPVAAGRENEVALSAFLSSHPFSFSKLLAFSAAGVKIVMSESEDSSSSDDNDSAVESSSDEDDEDSDDDDDDDSGEDSNNGGSRGELLDSLGIDS